MPLKVQFLSGLSYEGVPRLVLVLETKSLILPGGFLWGMAFASGSQPERPPRPSEHSLPVLLNRGSGLLSYHVVVGVVCIVFVVVSCVSRANRMIDV
jgi:hypothetical protein